MEQAGSAAPVSGAQLSEWITRGARGEEAACAALFQAFYPSVVRLSLGLLNDLADAEEVAQDTFVYALRHLSRYDASRSAFRTWLFTIALSRCRNKRRRKQLIQTPLELLAGAGPATPREVEAALERRGLRRQLWEALQSLSEPVREAVVLRYLGEMRYKEVGVTLGCNPKTAESRVRLGLDALRRALTEPDMALNWEWSEASA
jgi:RNA polymerase sigma-70 factor (ECF subfamily)